VIISGFKRAELSRPFVVRSKSIESNPFGSTVGPDWLVA
jgi:hypothetical protein